MKGPSISIAISTCNGERYIPEQLSSIISQTRQADFVVLIDDASTDDSVSIARRLLDNAGIPFEVVVNQTRLGPWENFLHALGRSKTDLVAFCDQDDVWADTKLEKVSEPFEDARTSLVIHNALMTDADLRPLGRLNQGIRDTASFEAGDLDPYLGPTAGWGNCMTFRRSIAMAVDPSVRPIQPGEERLLSHDTWVYILCAALGRVTQLADDLVLYRQHGGNVTDSQRGMRVTWQDRLADPSRIFTRRAEFYNQFADALQTAEPATVEGDGIDGRVQKAIELYRRRAYFWSLRASVYTAKRRRERFAAYLAMQRLTPSTDFRAQLRLSARLKELVNLLLRPPAPNLSDENTRPRVKLNGRG